MIGHVGDGKVIHQERVREASRCHPHKDKKTGTERSAGCHYHGVIDLSAEQWQAQKRKAEYQREYEGKVTYLRNHTEPPRRYRCGRHQWLPWFPLLLVAYRFHRAWPAPDWRKSRHRCATHH